MENNDGGARVVAYGGGCGFCGLLTIALLVLKCIGVINISWWIVFLPVIVVAGIPVAIMLIFLICCLVAVGISALKQKEPKTPKKHKK